MESLCMIGESGCSRKLLPQSNNVSIYKLSSRLFTSPSFLELKTLVLSHCEFTSSSISFEVFKMLAVIKLRCVIFKDCSSTPWSFRCPLLSSLALYGCGGFRQEPCSILIEAPLLKCFYFVGHFRSLHLKQAPLLKKVTILKQSPLLVYDRDESSLLKIWNGLVAVESLHVTDHFYQYLAIGDKEINLSPLNKLRQLTFDDVCLMRRNDAWSLLLMITSSPNLQQLSITLKQRCDTEVPVPVTIAGFLDVHEIRDRTEYQDGSSKYKLSQLKRVEVKMMMGTTQEMAFVGWLLKSTPELDKMKINLLSTELEDAERVWVLTELNGLQRRSMRARIVFD